MMITPVAGPLRRLGAEIAEKAAALGRRVELDIDRLVDRSDQLELSAPGLFSPNRACRLVQAGDGWLAVNLARDDDIALIPAWLGVEVGADPWPLVVSAVREERIAPLLAIAGELGLPVAGVGEVRADRLEAPLLPWGTASRAAPCTLRVVDLSVLWAGPLCGAVLASAGCQVTKVESRRRPDPSRLSTPDFHRRLNGAKAELILDFAEPEGIARLRELMLGADVVITSARPRAFEQLGLSPASLFAQRPDLVWVAVSGYGWTAPAAGRVAFGDDAAAAGGLVRWTTTGEPHFLGDALGDPLAGMAAAAGALEALGRGGGWLVDAALARSAAGAAAELGLAKAA